MPAGNQMPAGTLPGAAGFSQGILQASLCAQRCTDRKPEAGGTKFTCLFSGDGKCQSIEAVQAYGESVLSDISKHLTADQTGSKHRVILELLTYLDEHYDQDIGLSELADRAGMSTAYLSVLFKTEVGTSYVKYLTDLRIKKAKKLLQDGYKVNEVSEMVGYNNYRYFCDIFKKHEGMTPNEYKGNVWKAE